MFDEHHHHQELMLDKRKNVNEKANHRRRGSREGTLIV